MKRLVLAAALTLAVAAPATATVRPFVGTLSITIAGQPFFDATGSGVATINGSRGGHPITQIHISGTWGSAGGTFVDLRSLSLTGPPGQLFGIFTLANLSGNLALPLASQTFNAFEVSRNTNSESTFVTDTLVFRIPLRLVSGAGGATGEMIIGIHLIPEPGTLVLLGAGVVGLALYGHRRRKL